MKALVALLKPYAADVVLAVVDLVRLALSGSSPAEVARAAEKVTTLAAYKRSYRRE